VSKEYARKAIMDAFVEMMGEMSLDVLRVQDMVVRAGVSKATFYRQFMDKYDVANCYFTEQTKQLVEENPDVKNWKDWSYVQLAHIKENKAVYKNIISYKGQNSLEESMRRYYQTNIMRSVCVKYGGQDLPDWLLFAIDALTHVNSFAVISWINQDCKPSIDVQISYVERCIPPCLRPYFE